jgi:serine/threonine-protein kinase
VRSSPSLALTEPLPALGAPNRSKLIAALAGGLVVVIAVIVYTLLPSKGGLLVNVAGPNNTPVDNASALIDGQPGCKPVPCRVAKLPTGPHLVRVIAPGYQRSADEAISVESGRDTLVNIKLARANTSTGIEVKLEATDLHVFIDGKDRGTVPAKLTDLTPGDYTVRLEGSPLYAPYEQKVSVEADKLVPLEPKLKVVKGLITVKPGIDADGVTAYMVSGGKRRQLPKLPARIEVPPTESYQVVATKRGYRDFEAEVGFADGKAEKTVDIDLVASGTVKEETPAQAAAPARVAPPRGGAVAPPPPPAAAAGGEAKLAINSIPISNVIVDGKPVGTTPKQLTVTPGTHTVVFIHPELGRKTQTVSVQAGKTAVAATKFP